MISADDQARVLAEALWEAERQYGERLSAADQVGVARELARLAGGDPLTNADVDAAFRRLGLKPPPRGYAGLVLSKARHVSRPSSIFDELISFRQFAIGNLSRRHGGRTRGNEDSLRDSLLTYLHRGYAEAHTGRGRTDIVIPEPEDTIIEVKVWTGRTAYEDGVEELARYIHTARPKRAFVVVFGDREPLPPIVEDHIQAVAEVRELEGLRVPVIVVPFEVDPPSKAAAKDRRRKRDRG
jgi:hypothetical protein